MDIQWHVVTDLAASCREAAESRIEKLGEGQKDLIHVVVHVEGSNHHQHGAAEAGVAQAEALPLAVLVAPVERGAPSLLARGCPTVRQPQRGRFVAAVVDELEILACGHASGRQLVWLEMYFVSRHFVVEAEAVILVTDFDETDFAARPLQGRRYVAWLRDRLGVAGP